MFDLDKQLELATIHPTETSEEDSVWTDEDEARWQEQEQNNADLESSFERFSPAKTGEVERLSRLVDALASE